MSQDDYIAVKKRVMTLPRSGFQKPRVGKIHVTDPLSTNSINRSVHDGYAARQAISGKMQWKPHQIATRRLQKHLNQELWQGVDWDHAEMMDKFNGIRQGNRYDPKIPNWAQTVGKPPLGNAPMARTPLNYGPPLKEKR